MSGEFSGKDDARQAAPGREAEACGAEVSAAETPAAASAPDFEAFSGGWARASLAGWRLWLEGGWGWRAAAVALICLNLSFLPWAPAWPPSLAREGPAARWAVAPGSLGATRGWGARSPWYFTAQDSHYYEIAPGADFFAIYEAGWRARHGMDPYSVNTRREPLAAPYMASFRYIPLTAWLLAAPLSLLPPWTAFALWILLNEAALLFNLGLTAALAPRARRRALGALWLAFWPLHIEWHMGQFSFLMGCLLFWSGLALAQGRLPRANLFWGLSTWLKNWTAIFWLWWLGRGRARATAATLWIALAALTSAGYFLALPEARASFYAAAADRRLAGGVGDLFWGRQGAQMAVAALLAGGYMEGMEPPRGFGGARRAFGHNLAPVLNAAISLGALAWILALALRRGPRAPHPLDLLGLVWLWWFFAYLDTWEHHYVMLLPLAALLGAAGRLDGRALWIPAIVWAAPSLYRLSVPAVAYGWPFAPLWVILYFVQRPLGVAWVFLALSRQARPKSLLSRARDS